MAEEAKDKSLHWINGNIINI